MSTVMLCARIFFCCIFYRKLDFSSQPGVAREILENELWKSKENIKLEHSGRIRKLITSWIFLKMPLKTDSVSI